MWFKQVQVFEFEGDLPHSAEDWVLQLTPMLFEPGLPTSLINVGWVTPVDEDEAPLTRSINGYTMLCAQVEEKILPASVVRDALELEVKKIQREEGRKVRSKEKLDLKDEVILTLLPRAFSRLTRVYGFVDARNHWLVLGTNNPKKTENFLALFKKSVLENIKPLTFKRIPALLTEWLKNKDYPKDFSIEKACLMRDPQEKSRTIRCQEQDLFFGGIQSLLKAGCEVQQLALCWQDQIRFTLLENGSLRGLQFDNEIVAQASDLEGESRQQQFDADFLIMTEALAGLLKDVLSLFLAQEEVA